MCECGHVHSIAGVWRSEDSFQDCFAVHFVEARALSLFSVYCILQAGRSASFQMIILFFSHLPLGCCDFSCVLLHLAFYMCSGYWTHVRLVQLML